MTIRCHCVPLKVKSQHSFGWLRSLRGGNSCCIPVEKQLFYSVAEQWTMVCRRHKIKAQYWCCFVHCRKGSWSKYLVYDQLWVTFGFFIWVRLNQVETWDLQSSKHHLLTITHHLFCWLNRINTEEPPLLSELVISVFEKWVHTVSAALCCSWIDFDLPLRLSNLSYSAWLNKKKIYAHNQCAQLFAPHT